MAQKRNYATVADDKPWLIYRDPLNSDNLDPQTVNEFLNNFFEDVVSKCPSDQHIQFVFKTRWSTANADKPLILHYIFNNSLLDIEIPKFFISTYSNLETVSNINYYPDLSNKFISKTMNIIFDFIRNDSSNKNIILDFDSMFILYRYLPNKPAISTYYPPSLPYGLGGDNNFSKRYYSTSAKIQPWIIYEDPLNSIDLNKITIETFLFNFFRDIISNYPNGQFIKLMFKVRYYSNKDNEAPTVVKMFRHNKYVISKSDFIIRSFSKIQSIEHILGLERKTIKNLLNVIMYKVDHDSDNYNELSFKNMFISYQPIDNADYVPIPESPTIIGHSEVISLEAKHIKPTMDIETWNDKINFLTDTSAFFGRTAEDGLIYTFVLSTYSYTCKVIDSKYNLVLKFRDSLSKDVFSQGGLDTFTREIIKESKNGKEYISKLYKYINGVQTYFEAPLNSRYIEGGTAYKKSESKKVVKEYKSPVASATKRKYSTSSNPPVGHSPKILTLDLETRRLSDDNLEVISNCIYDGSTYETFYLTDYNFDQDKLLKASIEYLLKPWGGTAYKGYNIYVHNLSMFDGIFILKNIVDLKKIGYTINILYKDDKMIQITIQRSVAISKELGFESESFSITFYDSYLLLPTSLNKLARSFGLETKLEFDVLLNDSADLTDIGFKEKLLEYNKYDCKLLYDIITNFRIEIINLFGVDISNSPTLPSLAFKIYVNKFLNHKIPITWLEDYKKIGKGYRGGSVDVYRPSGENLFYYDANSLYPYAMKTNLFPVGEPITFEGDRDLYSIYGIVYAKIIAPENLNVPILLVKNDQTNRKTIAPLGSWEGWYVSEELKFAEKYGYKIEIVKGYRWNDKADIFSGYVDTLYENRLKYDKSNPKNFISKLLMNSLYGKFGMSPILMNYDIYSSDSDIIDIIEECAEDIINFGDIKLIGSEIENNSHESYKKVSSDKESGIKTKYEHLLKISTPIAMFVTAYSRIHMNRLKFKYQDNIYYTDTDSIILDVELPESLISNKLGDLKMEYKIKKGIFLAPKVYGLLLEDGTEVVKVKGSKMKIKFSELEPLLQKEAILKITQEKWFKNLPEQHIKILKILYTLKVTDNKRQLVYKDGILVDTKPIII
jgi:hypothetical protein